MLCIPCVSRHAAAGGGGGGGGAWGSAAARDVAASNNNHLPFPTSHFLIHHMTTTSCSNLPERYHLGKVIGAGSFGTVREAVEIASGRRYAIKTVSKVPKRGPPTPRYLLKLRAEVEVMQQLGVSLNAVSLHDVFEDDGSVHMVMELCEGGALLERVESRAYSERYIAGLVRSILRFIAQCHAKVRRAGLCSGPCCCGLCCVECVVVDCAVCGLCVQDCANRGRPPPLR